MARVPGGSKIPFVFFGAKSVPLWCPGRCLSFLYSFDVIVGVLLRGAGVLCVVFVSGATFWVFGLPPEVILVHRIRCLYDASDLISFFIIEEFVEAEHVGHGNSSAMIMHGA